MKTKITFAMLLFTSLAFFNTQNILAQQNSLNKRSTVTVLNIDVHGLEYTPEQLGNLVRLELEKLDTFEVMDRYDVVYLVKKNNLDISNCYGKIGLVEVGKSLNSQKMLSGSADLYGETIILTFRLVDVNNSVIEKSYVREFLNLPKEMQSMIRVSLRELFGLSVDSRLLTQLTKPNTYETVVNNPESTRLNLSGPRMGVTYFTGEFRQILKAPEINGGFNMYPLMYQFGYQFEAMYLNDGNFQALFEFVPMITGINQNVILPSLTVLNGVRINTNGWELALGPTFAISKVADVYQDSGKWKLKSEAMGFVPEKGFTSRADSRGKEQLTTSFVIAIGKTFKSGKMNFPVNLYCIPRRDGVQFGISLGYNAKNKVK